MSGRELLATSAEGSVITVPPWPSAPMLKLAPYCPSSVRLKWLPLSTPDAPASAPEAFMTKPGRGRWWDWAACSEPADAPKAQRRHFPSRATSSNLWKVVLEAGPPKIFAEGEAKVNEPFDDIVSAWIFDKEMTNARSPPHRTKVIQRYARAFGKRSVQLLDIRYQLLQRTLRAALTAAEHGSSRAWMVVHAFSSGAVTDGHQRNRSDFDKFVSLVGSAPTIENVCVRIAWVSDKITSGRTDGTPA